MRLIPTTIHGVLDYLVGALLVGLPWLLGFAQRGPETWAPVAIGAATILFSLLTDYELGVARVVPMRIHLWLDGLGGLLLAASPWLLGFADVVWEPHAMAGLVVVAVALLTTTVPSYCGPEEAGPRGAGGVR